MGASHESKRGCARDPGLEAAEHAGRPSLDLATTRSARLPPPTIGICFRRRSTAYRHRADCVTSAVVIDVGSQERRRLWWRAISADPNSMVTQAPEWMDALTSLGKWEDATRFYEMPGGRLAVLPMARRPHTGIEASPPHAWGFGGLVAEGGVTDDDVRVVLADLDVGLRVRTSIRPNPLLSAVWERGASPQWTASSRLAHIIDLDKGSDAVWACFHKDVRKRVRRAERLGVEIECDTTGRLIPVLYELFERSVIHWASLQHEPVRLARLRARRRDPIEKFQAMAAHLGSQFKLWVARHEGRPVAASLILQDRNAHTTRLVMDRSLAATRSATSLLEWHAIRDACRADCGVYHMGESGPSTPLAKSKERFGAIGHSYFEYRRERIPLSTVDGWARSVIKRVIGFKE